jgi:predicted ATPase
MPKQRTIKLPAPYLRSVQLVPEKVERWEDYPFCLPLFREKSFEIAFDDAVTIIVGENGVGKSTLFEGIAEHAGFGLAGGSTGHVLGTTVREASLAKALKLSWLPKVTRGYFFRAETFFGLVRYLIEAAKDGGGPPPDWLDMSHGEGFLAFFEERCMQQGIYIFDEPESALSPSRQIEFLKLLRRMRETGHCQVIMATHSPILMGFPDARLLRLTPDGFEPTTLRETDHFRLMREFCADPEVFLDAMMSE